MSRVRPKPWRLTPFSSIQQNSTRACNSYRTASRWLRARMPAFGRASTFRSSSIWFADMLFVVIGSRASKLRRKRFTHKWPNVWEKGCPAVGSAYVQKRSFKKHSGFSQGSFPEAAGDSNRGCSIESFVPRQLGTNVPWRMACRESILGTSRWNQRPYRSARRVTFALTGHALQRFATSRGSLFCRLLLRNDSPGRILNYWIYVFYCNCLGPLL